MEVYRTWIIDSRRWAHDRPRAEGLALHDAEVRARLVPDCCRLTGAAPR